MGAATKQFLGSHIPKLIAVLKKHGFHAVEHGGTVLPGNGSWSFVKLTLGGYSGSRAFFGIRIQDRDVFPEVHMGIHGHSKIPGLVANAKTLVKELGEAEKLLNDIKKIHPDYAKGFGED